MKEIINRIITGLIMGLVFWIVFTFLPPLLLSIFLLGILLQILIFEWPKLRGPLTPASALFTLVYPVLPFALIIFLNQDLLYRQFAFLLMIIVSTYDTAAYIIGSLFGRTKLAPTISPGKTWEGFFGGYLCAFGGLAVYMWQYPIMPSTFFMAWFSLAVCIVATIGDLFESWLKRRAQVKDAGNVLPGHGGFLDRVDALMVVVLVFFVFKDALILILGLQ